MRTYQLKTGKLGRKIAGSYKKVEDAFVERFLEQDPDDPGTLRMKTGNFGKAVVRGYQKVEKAVVGAYCRVEHAFADTFLEEAEEGTRRGTPGAQKAAERAAAAPPEKAEKQAQHR